MRLTFVYLPAFQADCGRLKVTDDDLRDLERTIMADPKAGKVIRGTGGLRKLRFAPPSWRRGKSNALRVCYAHFPAAEAVYLFVAYTHQEQDNLSDEDRAYFARVLKAYGDWLSKHYPSTGRLP